MILKLREGVKFHDGTDFDAEAVKVNIMHTKDPETRSLFTADFAPIQEVEVVDKSTAKLKLNGAAAPLLASFGMQAGHMISPAALQKYGKDAGRNPVGTGPYQFVEWVEQDHITLKRNPSYWDPNAALLDEVVFRIVPDPTVPADEPQGRRARLDHHRRVQGRQLDAQQPGLPAPPDLGRGRPLHPELQQAALREHGAAPGAPARHRPPGHAPRRSSSRPASSGTARSTHRVAGHTTRTGSRSIATWRRRRPSSRRAEEPDGFEFSLLASDPINQQIAEAYQAMFAPLGVKVSIQKVDSAKRVADQQALNYEASLSTWQMSPDPSPALFTPYHSKGSGNYLKYSNARVDELLEKAIATYDRNQRRAYYREVDQILADEAPCPIPYHRARFDAASNKVQGIAARPDPQFDLRGVSLKS